MFTPQQIDEMEIDALKAGLFSIMDDIVAAYGDDQSSSVSCPGQQGASVALPGTDDLPVQSSEQGGR